MLLRDYDAARKERQRKRDPVQFKLGGELFTLLDKIPIGDTLDLAKAPEPTPETAAEAALAIATFLRNVLVSEDRPRFDALLRRTTDVIDPWTIIEVGADVAESYAARPIWPSSDSSDGRPPDGETLSSSGLDEPVASSAT